MYTAADHEGHVSKVKEPSPEYSCTYTDCLRQPFEERLELYKGKIVQLATSGRRLPGLQIILTAIFQQ